MALSLSSTKLISFLVLIANVVVSVCPSSGKEFTFDNVVADKFRLEPQYGKGIPVSRPPTSHRAKRSPFIMAFQVTRPPGLFQFSMRKPVIMGVMSNMTSMLLGSELARMLSRGLSSSGLQQFLVPLNASTTVKKS